MLSLAEGSLQSHLRLCLATAHYHPEQRLRLCSIFRAEIWTVMGWFTCVQRQPRSKQKQQATAMANICEWRSKHSPQILVNGHALFSSQSEFQTFSATCLMSSWHSFEPDHAPIQESERWRQPIEPRHWVTGQVPGWLELLIVEALPTLQISLQSKRFSPLSPNGTCVCIPWPFAFSHMYVHIFTTTFPSWHILESSLAGCLSNQCTALVLDDKQFLSRISRLSFLFRIIINVFHSVCLSGRMFLGMSHFDLPRWSSCQLLSVV